MKWVRWAILAFLLLSGYQSSVAYAIDTTPSSGVQTKVNGPLLITAYSFSGHSLRYVQLFNASGSVASLDGWRVSVEYAPATQQIYATLAGDIAPGKYVTVANTLTVPTATFGFMDSSLAADPTPISVSLLAPATSNFNNEIASPSITTSTPRVAGTPATFHFARNISSSTGNFLTTFTAFVPAANFSLISDGIYHAPSSPELRIIEVYPDAKTCSPFETEPTCSDYVKILNPSNAPINLSMFRVRTGQSGSSSTSSNTSQLQGVLQPGHSASFPLSLSSSGSWVWLEDAYGTTKYESTLLAYPTSSGHDNEAWSVDGQNVWQWTVFPTPGDMENTFAPATSVNQCNGLAVSEIAANVTSEDQYIELYNPTDAAIELTGCVLQTNRSTTKQYVFGAESLEPGAYRTIYIKDTELTLTKTTTGTVYVLSSDIASEVDAVTYENLNENTAWANVMGNWLQTYAITPNAENVWLQYPACESGYVRNNETGLCNKIAEPSNALADCGVGKERNPDTNRCRTIVSTVSLLTPCAPNQERNPVTNRCRSVGSSTTELKSCAANQERNPDTNRCRNKATSTTTDFPVQAVAQSGEATLGWWAFGGVGTLAAGYASWEWRREVLSAIKKASGLITGRF
jgi:hypothetical protein